jgi:hypothetical protein
MDTKDFITVYPRLYHMAAEGSWPSIRDHGLLTTKQQVERCRPPLDVADAILTCRRPQTLTLRAPDGTSVFIRDQKPLLLHNLKLLGTDLSGWLDILNSLVFFWVDEARLGRLLQARAYRANPQDVITVNTAGLVRRHGERVRLSSLNSGATIFPFAPPRGPDTFQPMGQFRRAHQRSSDGRAGPVVEVAVIDGVPDIRDFTEQVSRVHNGVWTTVVPGNKL